MSDPPSWRINFNRKYTSSLLLCHIFISNIFGFGLRRKSIKLSTHYLIYTFCPRYDCTTMNIGKQFNTLTVKEYCFYIDNYTKYTDFNTLGLYRSILENKKLSLPEKLHVREYAHQIFEKTFDFLQLKDPKTYFDICTLGQELTQADEHQFWHEIRRNQERILADKKIRHRNFGTYSKHNCGYDTCPLNGLMIKQGSRIAETHMWFHSDKNTYPAKLKSERRKKERKNEKNSIRQVLDDE